MSYLLDTNVLSALRRPERSAPEAIERINALDRSRSFVSVITLMEMQMGVLAKARQDARQAAVLDRWVAIIRARFSDEQILGVDLDISLRCAALHVPDRRPYNDALIAATALVRGLTLVTRNTVDFQGLGLAILNPWDAA